MRGFDDELRASFAEARKPAIFAPQPIHRRQAVRIPWLSARLHSGTPPYQEPSATAAAS